MTTAPFRSKDYGFKWGDAEVTRLGSGDPGWVVIEIKSQRRALQVYVTRTGKMRLFAGKTEVQLP